MQTYQRAAGEASEERERLILEHLPQVRLIARRIHERLPESVSLDDLVSTGTIGLIAAIDHFNPAHNVRETQAIVQPKLVTSSSKMPASAVFST